MSTQSGQSAQILGFYVTYLVLHCLIIVFILHNVYKYLYGLKMRKPLITAFYAVLLFSQICRIVEFGCFIKYRDTMTHSRPEGVVFYAWDLGFLASLNIMLILILTMHRLYLALNLVNGGIAHDKMLQAQRAGLWATILAFLGITCTLAYLSIPWERAYTSFYGYFLAFFILSLTVAYSVVMILLNRVMQRLTGDFKNEIWSVNCQFAAYLIGFGKTFVVITVLTITHTEEKRFIWFLFAMRFFTQILPPVIVLSLHYKAFNPQTVREKAERVQEDQMTKRSTLIQIDEFCILSQTLDEPEVSTSDVSGTQKSLKEIAGHMSGGSVDHVANQIIQSRAKMVAALLQQTTQGHQFKNAFSQPRSTI